MRKIIFHITCLLLSFVAEAQQFSIQPLACGVWGEENWTVYTEKDLQRKVYPGPVSLNNYYNYQPSNEVLFLAKDEAGYINNLQCIRWSLEESATPFKVTVSENNKRIILYEAETKGCGLVLFPDSLIKSRYSTLDVVVEGGGLAMMQFTLHPMAQSDRKEEQSGLLSCAEIHCQVGTLIQHQKYREALSMLEIEKMRNPGDPDIDNLYWRTASRIRFCPLVIWVKKYKRSIGWCGTPGYTEYYEAQ